MCIRDSSHALRGVWPAQRQRRVHQQKLRHDRDDRRVREAVGEERGGPQESHRLLPRLRQVMMIRRVIVRGGGGEIEKRGDG